MPPAWTSGSRMDTAAWSRLGMAEVGSLVIRHHRPGKPGRPSATYVAASILY